MRTSQNDSTDAYLNTVARIEPDVAMLDRDGALASIAISLKRIADAMESANHAAGLNARLDALQNSDATK